MAKILVVDDRPLNRELLRTLLQYQAHEVLEAGEGAEALQVARHGMPDLIITDILMPNMDGYQFVKELRKDQQLAASTVIFYTASYKNREAQEMARSCGVEHLLFKPCEPEEILATVAQALASRAVPAADPLSSLASTSFRLTALTELCLDLSAELDPNVLLEKFCYSARELVKARFSVLLVDHDQPKCFMARQLLTAPPLELTDWQKMIPELFQERQVFCTNQPELAQTALAGLRNVLGVSLRSRTETYGWLCCFDKQEGTDFDEQDQHLMLTLAAQVGQTYENAVMYAQLQQQAKDLQLQNSELKKTQQALIQSQEHRRLARESAGIGTWDLDLKTQHLYWDDRMLEIYGLKAETFGNSLADWQARLHPDDVAMMMAESYEQTGQEAFRHVQRAFLPDGSLRYVECTGQMLFDDQYRPVRLVGIGIDITERRKAEAELMAREQLLENLTRQVPGMIYQHCRPLDRQSYMSYASEGIQRIFGLRPEEVRENASLLLERIHPADRQALLQNISEALEHMTVSKVTYRVCVPGEPEKWIYGESVPELLEDGSSIWYGYLVDITEQRQLAQSLSESEERLRLARDIAGVGIWELNLLNNNLFYDQRMYEIYEISPEMTEDLSEVVMKKIYPEDIAIFEQQLEDAIKTLKPVVTVARIRLSDGETRYVEGRAQAFLNLDGVPARMIGMTQDITERYLAQERLQDYQHQLEKMVVKLRELAIRAEAANLVKGEFLNNISHELRTPLNGVLGMSQLLLYSELPDTERGFAEIILESGKSLLALIDNVLAFSRLREHSLELENIEFSLTDLIDSVLLRLEPSRQRKRLECVKEQPPDLPVRLVGDAAHLSQVLYHLLENAIKFTQQGQVGLKLSYSQDSVSEVKIRFEIQDTGIGIAPDQIEQIFEAFNQGDNSLTRRFGGSGIGLSLATQLVEFMGGQLQCESQMGQGSCFWFELAFSLPVTHPEPPALKPFTQGDGPKILLVEDNPINQVVTVAILDKLGYRVTVAQDGREALNLCQTENWQLVLMDCQMPIMDGYEATRRIRQAEVGRGTHLPVIAVTAHVSEAEQQKCLACGMDDYLPKPFGLEELAEVIERWIGAPIALAD